MHQADGDKLLRPRLAWRPLESGPVNLTLIDNRGRSDRVEFEVKSLAE